MSNLSIVAGRPGGRGPKALILPQWLQDGGRRLVEQFEEHGVRPPEAADVDRIAGRDAGHGRSRDHVVLFSHRAIAAEIFQNHGEKFPRQAIGGVAVSVSAKPLNREQVNRRPPEWIIPLGAGLFATNRQPAGSLKKRQIFLDRLGLLFGCKADPERIERGVVFVGGLLARLEIVVGEKAATRIPKIAVDPFLSLASFSAPGSGIGRTTQQLAD